MIESSLLLQKGAWSVFYFTVSMRLYAVTAILNCQFTSPWESCQKMRVCHPDLYSKIHLYIYNTHH